MRGNTRAVNQNFRRSPLHFSTIPSFHIIYFIGQRPFSWRTVRNVFRALLTTGTPP